MSFLRFKKENISSYLVSQIGYQFRRSKIRFNFCNFFLSTFFKFLKIGDSYWIVLISEETWLNLSFELVCYFLILHSFIYAQLKADAHEHMIHWLMALFELTFLDSSNHLHYGDLNLNVQSQRNSSSHLLPLIHYHLKSFQFLLAQ